MNNMFIAYLRIVVDISLVHVSPNSRIPNIMRKLNQFVIIWKFLMRRLILFIPKGLHARIIVVSINTEEE